MIMEFEELLKRSEAYEKLLHAVRSCSAETKKEVLEEFEKEN